MNMHGMGTAVPAWLTAISWVFVGVALFCAAALLYDIYGRGHRQRVRAMEAVWPISALYFGPLALAIYARWGRPRTDKWRAEHEIAAETTLPAEATTRGITGGAASTLAHFIGVPLVVLSGLTIAGLDLWAMILVIAAIATALLFGFEYFVTRGRQRSLSSGKGVGAALAIALLTVLAFDMGMGGWMLFLHFFWIMPPPTDVAFLFLMQIGLVLGFLTGYPVMTWLAGRDTTEAA